MSGSGEVRTVRMLTILVLVALVLGLSLNATGLVDAEADETAKRLQLIGMLPTIFYLAAIWVIQRAFSAIAKGDAVEIALARLLGWLGVCLFLGGIARVFGEPWLTRLVLERPWSWVYFDVAAITLGCIGLLLVIVARPLREAARIRAELSEIV